VVHNDKKSHTGANLSLGGGGIISVSTKQKANTRSLTEAELVAIIDIISKFVWMKLFLQAQGTTVNLNVIMRNNSTLWVRQNAFGYIQLRCCEVNSNVS
jgi:hypothetical protein